MSATVTTPGRVIASWRCLQSRMRNASRARNIHAAAQNSSSAVPAKVRCTAGNSSHAITIPTSPVPFTRPHTHTHTHTHHCNSATEKKSHCLDCYFRLSDWQDKRNVKRWLTFRNHTRNTLHACTIDWLIISAKEVMFLPLFVCLSAVVDKFWMEFCGCVWDVSLTTKDYIWRWFGSQWGSTNF